MLALLSSLLRQIPHWDRPSKIAFGIALAMVLLMFALVILGGQALQRSALIGLFSAILALQGVVLWGNRHMVTPFTRAQRLIQQGNLDEARAVLETAITENPKNVDVLTLLGNTYRQLGDWDKSESYLRRALTLRPDYHFPLYGLGRTLMEQGRLEESIQMIKKSINSGAPSVVEFDLGHAYYRLGDAQQARFYLERARIKQLEPYRQLMTDYWLSRLNNRPVKLNFEGLPYWLALSDRLPNNAFRSALLADIDDLRTQMEDIKS